MYSAGKTIKYTKIRDRQPTEDKDQINAKINLFNRFPINWCCYMVDELGKLLISSAVCKLLAPTTKHEPTMLPILTA